ncbi:hypothetical protein LOK74_23335 [Brevibacillus humidisoli]|uniref:hypothetical protein n=1 Tax=Brevibacillus humidisoli TaxID=2895522 RepID=UPI001E29030E|nr:hypothetical protein [Brevibacillus humidisoli]UFJ40884.1 hypothetical protein LOK74_23335 [Brevibacillus humidisoli]
MAGAEGESSDGDLQYSYVHENEIEGNRDEATKAYFTMIGVRDGDSDPSGAQFGTYKIVDSAGSTTEKRYLYFYSDSISRDQSFDINYTADVEDLYTEMVVYADEKGIDGAQANIRYDRFAYTP